MRCDAHSLCIILMDESIYIIHLSLEGLRIAFPLCSCCKLDLVLNANVIKGLKERAGCI